MRSVGYVRGAKLGEGSYGEVYQARPKRFKKKSGVLVVKVLRETGLAEAVM